MGLFDSIFGSYSQRELKRINPIMQKVCDLEEKYAAMSDNELIAQTPALKERLNNGETTDDILPDDTAIAWSGVSFQEREEGSKGGWVFLIAFIFVFFTLSALYESWSLPIAIVLGVPLAVLGALSATGLAHIVEPKYINDIYLQISLVMLIGLAAKNSILVVEYADIMHRKQHLSPLDATIEAAKERVRPIIMTASASILGMLPLIFAMGVYSTARNIMGVALVGGLLFATLFGIFLYPALYYLIARNKKN